MALRPRCLRCRIVSGSGPVALEGLESLMARLNCSAVYVWLSVKVSWEVLRLLVRLRICCRWLWCLCGVCC